MTIKSSFLLLITSSLLQAGLVRTLPLLPGDAASPDYEVLVDGKPVPVAFGEFNGGHSFHHAGFEIDGASAVTVRFLQGRPDSVELLPPRQRLRTERRKLNSVPLTR